MMYSHGHWQWVWFTTKPELLHRRKRRNNTNHCTGYFMWNVQKIYSEIYPWTVLQSGSSISWARDVTCNVESVPSPPCTSTEAPSLSIHWAATHAHVNTSLTCVNQLQLSNLDSHLSILAFTSEHAEMKVIGCKFTINHSAFIWTS